MRARKRYTGVVLVSVTGLGMVLLFATSGAPDLALTQILVETVTLVAFALVLRRIPSRLGEHNASVCAGRARRAGRRGRRHDGPRRGRRDRRPHRASPSRRAFPDLAYELGHGKNVVNVALVDLRGWDTMGELSVLILAATGVASLVFVTHRADTLSALTAPLPRSASRTRRPLVETDDGIRPQSADTRAATAGVARRRSARAARESLDPARGDRADPLPHDHHRVAVPALRRPQPPRRRIRRRTGRRAWRW